MVVVVLVVVVVVLVVVVVGGSVEAKQGDPAQVDPMPPKMNPPELGQPASKDWLQAPVPIWQQAPWQLSQVEPAPSHTPPPPVHWEDEVL